MLGKRTRGNEGVAQLLGAMPFGEHVEIISVDKQAQYRQASICSELTCTQILSCSTEMVSMNDMMDMVKRIEGKTLPIKHIPGPEGVRGRNSDNKLILEKLGWEPTVTLEDGLRCLGWTGVSGAA